MERLIICGGCTKCCRGHDPIVLQPEDFAAGRPSYKTRLVNGRRELARKANGDCVYLGKRGCQIHGRAPLQCRTLDCRQYFQMVQGWTEEKRASRYASPHLKDVLDEGERRLRGAGL